jgi:hypothetical protein
MQDATRTIKMRVTRVDADIVRNVRGDASFLRATVTASNGEETVEWGIEEAQQPLINSPVTVTVHWTHHQQGEP